MLGKARSAVTAFTALVTSALANTPTVVPAPAGPGFHVALSHRRRLRLRMRRHAGLRQPLAVKRS
jgi:hypothetical protein